MTLKGHKNHYNVKLLRGYGISVSLKDNQIHLKDGTDILTGKSETESWFITQLPYEKIVISGKGYVSTEALKLLNQNYRNVILTDTYGKPVSFMNGMMESLTATKYRMAQYDTFRDPAKCRYLARQTIRAKIESQINFLKSTENELVKDGIMKLESHLKQIDDESLDPVKIEAPSSHVYFRNYARLIPAKYGFESRNNSSIRITKRRASDVINALLNYGYAVLAGEISKYVNGFGLDAYCGFMHKMHTGFQPLVYDLMEPFRWLVENTVYKLANSQTNGQTIRLKDYAFTKDSSVVLSDDLIRRFLELLERIFQRERKYEFKHGAKTPDGLKSVQEITVSKIMIENLIVFCVNKSNNLHIQLVNE
ncbi:MAG: CRISPR-associated endonuclease Cas1 [Thaumarchaeota archaeon]|nr:CRISPR-associated endonuclease Cas1 [Nitrososphaeria archaeon]NDB52301.1 CRISPR-associated endonuclease Cas1 [Nitrosopumilaceae archaeon]NDB92495.1 CRISPR-associated endonuclease Cas1 [Nitrososphaeria archaeon]NDF25794.1 CRISPR-associated endonuclease Cas1 [Nitrososphaerota archaeon]NDF27689.1 CRISPR-associated endonuclease Cas1 [Nitrosopumilaceae archaeon]